MLPLWQLVVSHLDVPHWLVSTAEMLFDLGSFSAGGFDLSWFSCFFVHRFGCPSTLHSPQAILFLEWNATDFGRDVGLNDLDTTFWNPSFASDLVGKSSHCSTIQVSKPFAKMGASTRSYRQVPDHYQAEVVTLLDHFTDPLMILIGLLVGYW